MQQYTEFTLNNTTYKAYHSLENLYRIESTGINLTELCINSIDAPPSLTVTRNILELALYADIQDKEKTKSFVNDFINKKRFLSCNLVREFILSALMTPKDDEAQEAEKKITAS